MAYNRIAGIGKLTLTSGNTTNPTVLQTMDNLICFCGNITGLTVSNNGAFATLPDTITSPTNTINFLAPIYQNSTYQVGVFYLASNGRVGTRQALSNAQVMLMNAYVNMNDVFYNNTLGNNDESTMTRPIMVN